MTLAPGTPLVDVAQGATLEHSDGGQCGHSCPAGVVHASAAPCWLCAGSASVDRSWVTQCDWTRAPQPARRLSTKAIVATDLASLTSALLALPQFRTAPFGAHDIEMSHHARRVVLQDVAVIHPFSLTVIG